MIDIILIWKNAFPDKIPILWLRRDFLKWELIWNWWSQIKIKIKIKIKKKPFNFWNSWINFFSIERANLQDDFIFTFSFLLIKILTSIFFFFFFPRGGNFDSSWSWKLFSTKVALWWFFKELRNKVLLDFDDPKSLSLVKKLTRERRI